MRLLLVSGLLLLGAIGALLASLATGGDEDTLTGTLIAENGGYTIEGKPLGLGPDRYVTTGTAPADYDRDGAIETVRDELDGLVGTTVTVENTNPNRDDGTSLEELWKQIQRGHFDWPPGDQAFDVYVINGLPYRDPDDSPPWAGEDAAPATPVATPVASPIASPAPAT